MAARLPQLSRLVQDDHSGTYKNNNQARFTALTIIGTLKVAIAGSEPDMITKRHRRFNDKWLAVAIVTTEVTVSLE